MEQEIFHFFKWSTKVSGEAPSAENSGKPQPRSRPSASIFGPSGLIRQPLQQSSFSPPILRGVDKTLAANSPKLCA